MKPFYQFPALLLSPVSQSCPPPAPCPSLRSHPHLCLPLPALICPVPGLLLAGCHTWDAGMLPSRLPLVQPGGPPSSLPPTPPALSLPRICSPEYTSRLPHPILALRLSRSPDQNMEQSLQQFSSCQTAELCEGSVSNSHLLLPDSRAECFVSCPVILAQ